MSWKLKISKNSEKSKIFPSGSKPGFAAVKSGNQKPLTTNQIDMRSNPDGGIIFYTPKNSISINARMTEPG